MPGGLLRYADAHSLHFITFSCYRRQKCLDTAIARNHFVRALEPTRKWYGFYVVAFVVMPEHVHLLISEPERKTLPIAIQMLKQIVSAKFARGQFWQVRYHDDLVHTERHLVEAMRYIHRNPVKRGLVPRPEDWQWSSFNNHASGTWCGVVIESEWTGRERERMGAQHPEWQSGLSPTLSPTNKTRATRVGHGLIGGAGINERVGHQPYRQRSGSSRSTEESDR